MLTKHQNVSKFEGNARIAIIVAKFNTEITSGLEKGARHVLTEAGIDEASIDTFPIPGSAEIPLTAKLLAKKNTYDAVICIGAIIKGDTKHDYFIGKIVTDGMKEVSMEYEVPVLFGVLTTENLQQAQERSRDDKKNRGAEAAIAALEMIALVRKIQVEK